MHFGSFMPLRSIWDKGLETLSKDFPEHRFSLGLKPDSPEIADLALMLAGNLPKDVYLASPKLKGIFQSFTGINHLPLIELRDRNVQVFNVHANAFDVAEKALALCLAYYGRIVEFHNDLSKELWHGFWVKAGAEDNWNSLFGKTCTVLGTGAVGQALAKLLKAFSCQVIGWRRKSGLAVPDGFDKVVPDLKPALDEAEIVFVTLPATNLTQGLLSRELLLGMKGKFLVNVGRGSIVDEEGLYLALKDGILLGAGIDAWYTYPQSGRTGAPSRYPIHQLPNVILSPHVGGSTHQATARAVVQTLDNIREYLKTGSCVSRADLDAMY